MAPGSEEVGTEEECAKVIEEGFKKDIDSNVIGITAAFNGVFSQVENLPNLVVFLNRKLTINPHTLINLAFFVSIAAGLVGGYTAAYVHDTSKHCK